MDPLTLAALFGFGGWLAGVIDSNKTDWETTKELNRQSTYLDELYALEEKSKTDKENQLAENLKLEQEDIELNSKQETEAINLSHKQMEESLTAAFEKNKEDAAFKKEQDYETARVKDLGQNIAETAAGTNFNLAIDNMFLNQQNDTMQWNQAARQMAAQTGASYAALAGSGIRAGSSLSDAVLMEGAANGAQLQFSQEAKRRSDSNNLASVLNGLAGTKYGIYSERFEAEQMRLNADYLWNSYQEGGSNWNIFQLNLGQNDATRELKLQNLAETSAFKLNKAQSDYNMGMQNILNDWNSYVANYAYKQSTIEEEKKKHTGWNSFWNAMTAGLTGGGSGFKSGYDFGTMLGNL